MICLHCMYVCMYVAEKKVLIDFIVLHIKGNWSKTSKNFFSMPTDQPGSESLIHWWPNCVFTIQIIFGSSCLAKYYLSY